MKNLKKLSALVLALLMILSLAATALATGADNTYTGSGDPNAVNTGNNARVGETTIPLTKCIVFFNANGSNVYEPNISFKYVVTPAMDVALDGTTATVTDGSTPPVTRNVYRGPAGGVYGGTYVDGTGDSGLIIAFTTANGTKGTAADGAEVEETGDLTFDASKFQRPGIYRYLITESVVGTGTDAANLAAAGLTARDSGYTTTRYLDVYVKYVPVDDDNDPSTPDVYQLKMYGAVIFVSTQTGSGQTPGTDDITTTTEKTTGFQPGVGSTTSGTITYANDTNVDKYTTYDFIVKKTVSGTMADRNHEFPFYVAVSNSISGAKFTYTADASETFTGATNTSGAVELSNADFTIGDDAAATSTLKLKNNDKITLVGLPSDQTNPLSVVIKEFNDTFDTYTASVAATSSTDPTLISLTWDGTSAYTGANNGILAPVATSETHKSIAVVAGGFDSNYVATPFDLKANDTAGQILTIDNNLTEISPTGVVLRVAPFALMLAAGIVLFLFMRRRRDEAEEA